MKKFRSIFIISFLFIILISCDGLKKARNIFETSERIKYERSFSGADSLMTQWKTNFASAADNQLVIKEDAVFSVQINDSNIPALGYSLELQHGQLLVVEAIANDPHTKIFVDISENNYSKEKAESAMISNGKFRKRIENTGCYKIIVQPEINFTGTFALKIYTQPSLDFPVSGKGNKDVQSFWGASRDGGGRSHEGIDIFARKGTPVTAVISGTVTRTGNQGLGGKQVWIRDSEMNYSYYYAHLDSIIANNGQRVKAGDTLGLVGSTGNAAGGAPHLHFGIYTSGGAIDPYPFVKNRKLPESVSPPLKIFSAKFVKAESVLRSGPGINYTILKKLTDRTAITILAAGKDWCHVKTSDGAEGFMYSDRLE
ncbi:M23 family metallopeptidase [Chryseobacterium echinoideorum]|uniref:M23 family metallopeptidase n=1 Tax=Chryseobacterium echinoideorum TaxID=1549648 RepID=UPI001627B2D5|nr:M23 family metallopeptidase [Chryseobacterium echinoideorum]